MNSRLWIMSAILVSFFLTGLVAAETFSSQEYGFSIEYPDEMTVNVVDTLTSTSVLSLTSTNSIGSIVLQLTAPSSLGYFSMLAIAYSGSYSQDELADAVEKVFKDKTKMKLISSKQTDIQGISAIEREYLLSDYSLRFKIVYFVTTDTLFCMLYMAKDSKFDRGDSMYFQPLLNSLTLFDVQKTITASVSGFPKVTGGKMWSSPAIADIDGDGKMEIVVGSNDNKLYAWNSYGRSVTGFPVFSRDNIRSSPAIGDLNGDGQLEIVFGSDDGKIYAVDSNGDSLPGFPVQTSDPVTSSPALYDIDGDGLMEIIVGSRDRGIYAISSDGSMVCGYPVITGYEVWSSPAVADLDGDGRAEIVIGSKRHVDDLELMVYASTGVQTSMFKGQIYALKANGTSLSGFPKDLQTPTLLDTSGSEIGYSSPVLADVDGDGSLDIVVDASDRVYAIKKNGLNIMGFPYELGGRSSDSSPAVGDLDGDGNLEIVTGAEDGRLYVIRNDGTAMPGYPIQTGGYVRYVSIGDINNDGLQEIIGGSTDNRVHAWTIDGQEVAGFPKVTSADVTTAPAIGDIDGDGLLEVVAASDDGSVYNWKLLNAGGYLAWPMMRQNTQNTGVVEV